MKDWTQILSALLAALVSGFLILGSLLLTLAQNAGGTSPQAGAGAGIATNPLPQAVDEAFHETLAVPASPAMATPVLPPSMTPPPQPTCGAPPNWPAYTVKIGETLLSIGMQTGATVLELLAANCMDSPAELWFGQNLKVPKLPAASALPATSTPPVTPLTGAEQGETTPTHTPGGMRQSVEQSLP